MNEFAQFKDLSEKFEDVSIYIHDLRLQLFREDGSDPENQLSAYTNVWHAMVAHRKVQGCELVGDLSILFRNQGNDFSSCLMLWGVVSASSEIDKNPRSVFCKLVQYLFEWMKDYCKEHSVMDSQKELFVLPEFGYSTDVFKNLPTE
jgi:hypothetical protein